MTWVNVWWFFVFHLTVKLILEVRSLRWLSSSERIISLLTCNPDRHKEEILNKCTFITMLMFPWDFLTSSAAIPDLFTSTAYSQFNKLGISYLTPIATFLGFDVPLEPRHCNSFLSKYCFKAHLRHSSDCQHISWWHFHRSNSQIERIRFIRYIQESQLLEWSTVRIK